MSHVSANCIVQVFSKSDCTAPSSLLSSLGIIIIIIREREVIADFIETGILKIVHVERKKLQN